MGTVLAINHNMAQASQIPSLRRDLKACTGEYLISLTSLAHFGWVRYIPCGIRLYSLDYRPAGSTIQPLYFCFFCFMEQKNILILNLNSASLGHIKHRNFVLSGSLRFEISEVFPVDCKLRRAGYVDILL